jgi:putative SOS response-associated peptidase YedK
VLLNLLNVSASSPRLIGCPATTSPRLRTSRSSASTQRNPNASVLGCAGGLIPYWAKDASIGYKMINARAATVASKPAFRDALRQRRCLIPADGFYEWVRNGKTKTPFCFTMADDSIFAFAGLWEQWKNPAGQLVETCSIITTTPNALLQDVHNRMPVILPAEAYNLWLAPGFQKTDAVCDVLKPFNPALMRRYEVSSRVNVVKNDDAACAEPVVREAAAGI